MCNAGDVKAERAHAPGTAIIPRRQVDRESSNAAQGASARPKGIETQTQDSRAGTPSARQNACDEHRMEGEFSARPSPFFCIYELSVGQRIQRMQAGCYH